MSFLLASTALGLGSAAFNVAAGFRAAGQHQDDARKAAEQARGYVAEDLQLNQAAIKDQHQELRANAIAQAHQQDMAQQNLSAQAAEASDAAVIGNWSRGGSGAGTDRGMQRMTEGIGREQSVFTSKAELSTASYRFGLRSLDRTAQNLGNQHARNLTGISDGLEKANQEASDMRRTAAIQGGFMALQTGMQYGAAAVEAGHWAGAGGAARAADREERGATWWSDLRDNTTSRQADHSSLDWGSSNRQWNVNDIHINWGAMRQ